MLPAVDLPVLVRQACTNAENLSTYLDPGQADTKSTVFTNTPLLTPRIREITFRYPYVIP